jgi:hypothetical protein
MANMISSMHVWILWGLLFVPHHLHHSFFENVKSRQMNLSWPKKQPNRDSVLHNAVIINIRLSSLTFIHPSLGLIMSARAATTSYIMAVMVIKQGRDKIAMNTSTEPENVHVPVVGIKRGYKCCGVCTQSVMMISKKHKISACLLFA